MPEGQRCVERAALHDGKTVEFPRLLLSESIVAIPEVYVGDDSSLTSMPLVDENIFEAG